MRKNGVNRNLTELDGGVCAPSGFYATAVCSDLLCDKSNSPDLALISSKKRCETAYLPARVGNVGSFVSLTQKHVRTSLSSAVLINSGVALGYGERADILAEKISRVFATALKIDRNEIIMISTGKYGVALELDRFETGAKAVSTSMVENSSEDFESFTKNIGKEFAYTFEIGDVVCKIGALFCMGNGVQSNFCVITTDVDISSEMLQKALKATANEHFYMLGGIVNTPNDCICALASGDAKNWKITENDSDYQKFSYALSVVAERICESVITEHGNGFLCRVIGAKSKNSAREIAKTVVESSKIKKMLAGSRLPTQQAIALALGGDEKVDFEKLNVVFRSPDLEIVAFEENKETVVEKKVEERLFAGGKIEIIIRLGTGNYTATAYGDFSDYIRA